MTAAPRLNVRWSTFVRDFFRSPNQLGVAQGVVELDAVVAAAERALAAEPPGPVIVPARVAGTTHYFCITFDRDQARTLRDLLRSHIGTTWTTFEGRPLGANSDLDPLESAAVALAGGHPEFVFRFEVGSAVRGVVRSTLNSLVLSLAVRPPREARIAVPIGRVLGDFADACAAGAEQAANEAYARLAADHRISAANRIFLHLQLLASFQEWDKLEVAPWLPEVLRLPRPALASDALARLALASLPSPLDLRDFEPVAARFGALIPSVGSIRSVAGARYYVLWSLLANESPALVIERMESAGWSEDPSVGELLKVPSPSDRGAPPEGDTSVAQDELRHAAADALSTGRLDAAVELLARLMPSADDLPAVVVAVRGTLTPSSVSLLQRYRDALGDAVISDAINAGATSTPDALAIDVVASLGERIDALLSRSISPADRATLAESVRQTGLADLLAPGGVDGVSLILRTKTNQPSDEINVEDGLDICIDLARDLNQSGPRESSLRSLSLAILELWAYHDRTGDRRRLRRVIQLVDDLLDLGVSASTYNDLVEFLRAGWDPFLTDVDLPAGLDTLELLLPSRPDASETLESFARPLLSRIGVHNARRLTSAALDVAVELAPEFGLHLSVPELASVGAEPQIALAPAGTILALYSLMEQAAERAASILRRRHPGIEVVTMADHVATDHLRSVARSADLLVVMDRAAKHAATDAIRAARGHRPIRFAAGKGSTSLVEAAEDGLRELSRPDAA